MEPNPDDPEDPRTSRRQLLKAALLMGAVGGLVVLGVGARPTAEGSASRAEQTVSKPAEAPSGGSVKVKVMYFQMPRNVVDASEEHFVLQSPAYFRDLKSLVVSEHPLLLPMFPTMLNLVSGVPATPTTELNDGDEVDFIPAVAGG